MKSPEIGERNMESKTKSIAVTGVIALAALKPTTKTELVIAACITLIVIVAISWQGVLDRKKNAVDNL